MLKERETILIGSYSIISKCTGELICLPTKQTQYALLPLSFFIFFFVFFFFKGVHWHRSGFPCTVGELTWAHIFYSAAALCLDALHGAHVGDKTCGVENPSLRALSAVACTRSDEIGRHPDSFSICFRDQTVSIRRTQQDKCAVSLNALQIYRSDTPANQGTRGCVCTWATATSRDITFYRRLRPVFRKRCPPFLKSRCPSLLLL